ncbi:MAG: hypothetical protein K5793_08110 [Nitrosarchaeum sp.]|nr:hypothetical protein [Nitrosarchaeum sp.]
MEKAFQAQKIPWLVFLFSITIVIISSVPVLFPAIIQSDMTGINIPYVGPDRYELGLWAVPVIATNITVFGLLAAYKKGRLPKKIEHYLKKLFEFETSKRASTITMIVIIAVYVAASAGELGVEEKWEDYQDVKGVVDRWDISQVTTIQPHVTYFFLKASVVLFDNLKVIPFIASIALLVTTYFFTKKISQKRFAGIVAVVIIMQSNIFLTYDSSVAYTNFWILFYMLSLYLVYKAWPLSPVSYVASAFSKLITAVFLPMSIYFILRSEIPKKAKWVMIGFTAAIIISGGVVSISTSSVTSGINAQGEPFDTKEFWQGFTSFSYQLRSDGLVLMFMIPLMAGLFLVSKSGIKHGESIMVLISGMLLIAPMLTGFTNQTNQPYRFVPLVVFFAVGVGVLLSKSKIPDE